MKSHMNIKNELTDLNPNSRVEKVQNYLKENDCVAYFVNNAPDVRYLTGAKGDDHSVAYELIVTQEKVNLIVSPLEAGVVHKSIFLSDFEVNVLDYTKQQGLFYWIKEALGDVANKKIILDPRISASTLDQFEEQFSETIFDYGTTLLQDLRIIKTPAEIERIETACEIADEALMQTIEWASPMVKSGKVSEREFAKYLENEMFLLGADELSFSSVVACAVNASYPHAGYTDQAIVPNRLIVCDFGAAVQGYHSDMTRTFSFGEPSQKEVEVWNYVLEAQQKGTKVVEPGISTKSVDEASRISLQAVGYDFPHGTGHGVGVEIHEAPNVSYRSEAILKENMVITVEPGVYLEGEFGVRIEDTVVVTKDGCRALTKFPKQLVF
jgi:Xaa-Pro aminopeptidase